VGNDTGTRWGYRWAGHERPSTVLKKQKRVSFAKDTETKRRRREVQCVLNIIEPDPEYQPAFLSDEASLPDCLGAGEDEMRQRLAEYFGRGFDLDLRQPLWKLIDQLKVTYRPLPERGWKSRSNG
jgi:hypothetical protein